MKKTVNIPKLVEMEPQDFKKLLRENFPDFFKYVGDPMRSLVTFGIECDSGWFPLIYVTTEMIWTQLNRKKYEGKKPVEVVQVKEKFGGLRYYYDSNGLDAEDGYSINAMIDLAEAMSYAICEKCGKPGSVDSSKAWIKTLCPECQKKRKNPNESPD